MFMKTFKEFLHQTKLTESPHPFEVKERSSVYHFGLAKEAHEKGNAELIGKEHYRTEYKGEHYFYHHNGKEIRSLSIFRPDSEPNTKQTIMTQHFASKGTGSADEIHQNMLHMAKTHDVFSDNIQSKGGNELWRKLFIKHPSRTSVIKSGSVAFRHIGNEFGDHYNEHSGTYLYKLSKESK